MAVSIKKIQLHDNTIEHRNYGHFTSPFDTTLLFQYNALIIEREVDRSKDKNLPFRLYAEAEAVSGVNFISPFSAETITV